LLPRQRRKQRKSCEIRRSAALGKMQDGGRGRISSGSSKRCAGIRMPGRPRSIWCAVGMSRISTGYTTMRMSENNLHRAVTGDLGLQICRADRALPLVRGAPCHTQTRGKIERWHQTLKNRICPVISKPRSRASSSTKITGVTMKAYRT
jgi:hypothetical protein